MKQKDNSLLYIGIIAVIALFVFFGGLNRFSGFFAKPDYRSDDTLVTLPQGYSSGERYVLSPNLDDRNIGQPVSVGGDGCNVFTSRSLGPYGIVDILDATQSRNGPVYTAASISGSRPVSPAIFDTSADDPVLNNPGDTASMSETYATGPLYVRVDGNRNGQGGAIAAFAAVPEANRPGYDPQRLRIQRSGPDDILGGELSLNGGPTSTDDTWEYIATNSIFRPGPGEHAILAPGANRPGIVAWITVVTPTDRFVSIMREMNGRFTTAGNQVYRVNDPPAGFSTFLQLTENEAGCFLWTSALTGTGRQTWVANIGCNGVPPLNLQWHLAGKDTKVTSIVGRSLATYEPSSNGEWYAYVYEPRTAGPVFDESNVVNVYTTHFSNGQLPGISQVAYKPLQGIVIDAAIDEVNNEVGAVLAALVASRIGFNVPAWIDLVATGPDFRFNTGDDIRMRFDIPQPLSDPNSRYLNFWATTSFGRNFFYLAFLNNYNVVTNTICG